MVPPAIKEIMMKKLENPNVFSKRTLFHVLIFSSYNTIQWSLFVRVSEDGRFVEMIITVYDDDDDIMLCGSVRALPSTGWLLYYKLKLIVSF